MVAYVSGNSLGWINGSAGVLGNAGQLGNASVGNGNENVLVNAATGNLIISHRDEYLSGLGLDLPILRTYNSQGLLNDDNGDNWRLGYSRTVSNLTGAAANTSGSKVTRTGEDGAAIVYTYDSASGQYVSDAGSGARDSLSFNTTTSGWTWTDGSSQVTERYASIATGGRLQSVTDRNGNAVNLTWNGNLLTRIAGADGERVDFIYDTVAGKTANLVQINTVVKANATDATATVTQTRVRYGYDSQNRLTSVKVDLTPADNNVTDGKTYLTSYTYSGTSDRIASITQTDGSQLQFIYDTSNRVAQVKDVRSATDIRITTLNYSVANQTTITDALGNASVMAYDANGQLTKITQSGIGNTLYGYDAKGNVTQVTDPRGNFTIYQYDSQDNRIYERDAAGNVVERRYGGGNQLLEETRYVAPDPDGNGSQLAAQPLTARYVYDAVGNLRFAISPEGRVTEYRYDAYGRQISQVTYADGTFDANAAQLIGFQDFSVNASGLTLPATAGFFSVANGVLNVTSQNGASATFTATGSYQPLGTAFSAEVTTDASSQRSLVIGAQNGASGTAARRLNAYFNGSALYANFNNAAGTTSNVQLLATVKSNTTYMVEVETTVSGATLYVYEKGQTRASGVQYQNTVAGWTQAGWQITAARNPAITAATTLKVDNLRMVGRNWQQDFTTPTVELFPDANAVTLGTFTQGNGVLTVKQQKNASTVNPATTGAAFTLPALLKGEISFAATDANRYLAFGLDNTAASGSSAYRRHAVELSNGNWNASSWDPVKAAYTTRTLGQAKPGVTYVVEVEVDVQGSTLYVYEKGKERSSGYVDRQAQKNWSNAKLIIGSRSSTTIPANINTTIDNLSINRLPSETGLQDWAARQNLATTQRVDTAYDFRGQVSKVSRYATINADGTTAGRTDTVFIYNAFGQLVQTIDPRGVATTGVANDYVTTYTYDGMGRTLTRSQTDANSASLTLSSTIYNDALRQSAVTLVNGLSTVTTFDQGGQAVSVAQADGGTGAAIARTDYALDKLGRTVASRVTTSAGSLLSSYALYDAVGRKVADIDAMGAMTEYVYNADSQVISTIAYASPVPSSLLSGDPTTFTLNSLRPAVSANDRIARNLYDAAGRLAKTINAEGGVCQYQYDGVRQLIATTEYSERLTATQLTALAGVNGEVAPADPNTIALADPSKDRITRNFYSNDGLLLGTLDAEGYLTEYRYDGAGQRVQTIQYAIATNAGLRASATDIGTLRPAANASDIASTFLYNDEGQITGTIDGEGYLTEVQYDAAGNVSQTIRYANKVTTSSVIGAAVDTVRPAASASDEKTISQYDAYNRVTQTQSLPDNLTTTYQYDNAGNLINVTVSPGANQRQDLKRYDALGRVTAELSGENAAKITTGMTQAQIDGVWTNYGVRYTYDQGGVVTSITQGMGPGQPSRKTLYYYDSDGRNTYTINAMGEVSYQVYDAFGGTTETWRYQARLTTAQLSTLTGGFQSGALTTAISAIAGSGVVKTRVTYTLRGQISKIYDGLDRNIEERVYNAFGELLDKATLYDPAQTMRIDVFIRDRRGLLTQEFDDAVNINAITWSVYDAFGRLTQSTGPTGVVTNSSYDRLGRTIITSIGSGTTIADRTVAYDAFGRTLTLTTSDGVTVYTYDDASRKVTITTPGGISTSSLRNEFGETVAITDGRGNLTSYQYNRDGQVTQVTDPSGNVKTDYDAAGEVIQTTDKNGIITTYTYDAAGRILTRTLDPSGLNITTATRYDALGEAIWSQDANGVWTRTDYDVNGRVAVVEVDPVKSPNWVSGANDNPNGLAIKTAYAYDAAGDVIAVTEGAGSTAARTTTYVYNNYGQRTKEIVDPAGLAIVTQYVYDEAGNVVQKIDGNGRSTYYGYDSYGRQTVVLNADNAVTYTLYDTQSRIKEVRQYTDRAIGTPGPAAPHNVRTDESLLALLPGGAANSNYASTQYLYDADGRQIYKVNAEGGVTKTEYDNAGNVVKTTRYAAAVAVSAGGSIAALTSAVSAAANAARDRATQYVYDNAGRLTWTVGAEGGVSRNEYDNAGNIVKTTSYAAPYAGAATASALQGAYAGANAGNRVTRYAYDAAGRNIATVDATGAVTFTQYDKAGNALSTTVYANVIGSASLNALPLVMTWSNISSSFAASSNDRVTRRVFDNAGNMRYEVDALNYVTENTYDALGLVKTTTRYANAISASAAATLNGIGGALIPDAAHDETDAFYYDKAGRLDHSTDALGQTEYYSYDALGNKKTFTNKKGDVWSYSYDNLGRLTKETSPQVTITGTTDAGGNAVVDASAGGIARIVTIVTYDALGNVSSRTEGAERAADGALIQSRTTSYTYDLVGRQIKTIFPPVSVYNSAADNVTAGSDVGSVTRSETAPVSLYSQVTYDALGNAVANIDVAGNVSVKAYDRLGQVTYDMDALGYVTYYQRNAFGEATQLVRFANATNLAPVALPSALASPSAAIINAAVNAAGIDHGHDRAITTAYDAMGRATLVTEPQTYTYDSGTAIYTISGKKTRTTYDAFGNAFKIEVSKADGTWLTTRHYFDKLNQETATADALNYLTEKKYDAVGNVIETNEYANAASASDASYTRGTADAQDRKVTYVYDRLNRNTAETRWNVQYNDDAAGNTPIVGNLTTGYAYDALGNKTSTTDAANNTTYTYYDVLGRITAVVSPARNITQANGSIVMASPVSEFMLDAYGNAVVKIDHANGATSATASGYSVAVDPTNDRITTTQYDKLGHAIEVMDAAGKTAYTSYDKAGHVAKQWRLVTDASENGGAAHTQFTVYQYDKLGRQTAIITPASDTVLQNGAINVVSQATAGTVTTQMQYNGFGEMVRKSTSGSPEFYNYDYDNAGRLWRTNSGDGNTKVMLYDLQGNMTAQITSAGSGNGDVDLSTSAYTDASQVAVLTNVRRTDYYYDALGRVTKQVQPERQQGNGAVMVRQKYLTFSTTGSVVKSQYNDYEYFADITNLTWTPLDGLGSGNVKVVLTYQPNVGSAKMVSQVFTSDQATNGVEMKWKDGDTLVPSNVTHVQILKADRNGAFQVVYDQDKSGITGNVIDVASPATLAIGTSVDAGVTVQLQYKKTGTTVWTTVPSDTLIDFGDALRFDASTLPPDNYDYQVVTNRNGVQTVTANGTLTTTSTPLATIGTAMTMSVTGLYTWQSPGADVKQVFNYRKVGTTEWTRIDVPSHGNGSDGVDLSVLPPGNYQYELLWTHSGELAPYAHATGTVTVPALAGGVNGGPVIGSDANGPTVIWLASGTDPGVLNYRHVSPTTDWKPLPAAMQVHIPDQGTGQGSGGTGQGLGIHDQVTATYTVSLAPLEGGEYEIYTQQGTASGAITHLSITTGAADRFSPPTASVTWNPAPTEIIMDVPHDVPATLPSATPTWSSAQYSDGTVTPTPVPATLPSGTAAWSSTPQSITIDVPTPTPATPSTASATWSSTPQSVSTTTTTTTPGTPYTANAGWSSTPQTISTTTSTPVPATSPSYNMSWSSNSGVTASSSISGSIVNNTFSWSNVVGGTPSLKYRVAGSGSAFTTINGNAPTEIYGNGLGQRPTAWNSSVSVGLPTGSNYEIQLIYTGGSGPITMGAGTLTFTAGVPAHTDTTTTNTTPPTIGGIGVNVPGKSLGFDMGGAAGSAQLQYVSSSGASGTLGASAINHGGSTTYTVNFGSLAAGTYSVLMIYTASGSSVPTAASAGTLNIVAATADQTTTTTTTTQLPLISNVSTNNAAQTFSWNMPEETVGAAQMRYFVPATGSWVTVPATTDHHAPSQTTGGGAPYTTYTVSFSSVPPGSYDVELDYTASGAPGFSNVTKGTMTITAGTAADTHMVSNTTPPLPVIDNILVKTGQTIGFQAIGAGMGTGTGSAQMRYRLSSTDPWLTIGASLTTPPGDPTTKIYNVDFSILAAGTYEVQMLFTASGSSLPTAAAAGTLTVTAGTPARIDMVPTPPLPLITGISTDNATQTFTWVENTGPGSAKMICHNLSTGAWRTIDAMADFNNPTSGGIGAQTKYSVSFSDMDPGDYEVELDYTAPFASALSKVTKGTINIAAGKPAQTVMETRHTMPPLISGGVWDNGSALGFDTVTESGSAEMRYRLPGGAWSTIHAIPTGGTPPFYGMSYLGVAPGTYEVQVLFMRTGNPDPSYAATGMMTISSVPVHYATQTATLGTTTSGAFAATPDADAGPVAISFTTAASTMNQHVLTNGLSTTARPAIFQTLDRWGNVLTISDARVSSWITNYTYNANNQMTSQSSPDMNGLQSASSAVTRWCYDRLGHQVATRDARTSVSADGTTPTAINGNVNGDQYDSNGNLIAELHADGGVIAHQYDAFGEEVRQVDAMNHATRYTYDKLGHRKSAVQDPVSVYTISNTNVLSNPALQSLTESMDYDEASRLIRQTNGNGEKVVYRYDLAGNIIATTQQGGITWDTYDAQNRKTAERDANGNNATWSYDYFGHLKAHTDLGGAVFSYSYDKAFQLIRQQATSQGERSGNQNLSYAYDAAGQMTKIVDSTTGETTIYAYDLAGNHVQEKVTKGTMVYEDNHLAYDTLGRLRDISNDKAHVTINYDANGNRTYITTHVLNNTGDNQDTYRWYNYDAMNRQTLVDGTSAAGGINAAQGHRITYDKNGNRKTDTRVTNKVGYTPPHQGTGTGPGNTPTPASYPLLGLGEVTESYTYDAMNRLTQTSRNDGNVSTVIDNRYYDAASRNLYSGAVLDAGYAAAMNSGTGNSSNITLSRYDVNGRMVHQSVLNSGGSARYDVDYTGIDAVGNVLSYQVKSYEGSGSNAIYTTTYKHFDGYMQDKVSGSGTVSNPGGNGAFIPAITTSTYDANGFLTGISDSGDLAKSRTFANDAQGHALWVSRLQGVEQQLVVNGEVLGRYGMAVDPLHVTAKGEPIYIDRADFNFGYDSVRSATANGPSVYTVTGGDTLAGIAQSFYGDSSLWYVIADANGLTSDADIQPGQTLTIPSRVAGLHNSSSTYQPYNAGQVVGDTTPSLTVPPPPPPQAGGGCGTFGAILIVIVIVVIACVTQQYYLANYATATTATGATVTGAAASSAVAAGTATYTTGSLIAAGAIGGAVGSVAGQLVGMGIGQQDGFDWNQVALGAIGGGVSGGLSQWNAFGGGSAAVNSTANVMARAAVANAITQGISVAVGLQDHFDWKSIAVSAAAAGIGNSVRGGVNKAMGYDPSKGFDFGKSLVSGTVSGLASGFTAAAMRGGRIDVEKIAVDAFGNALGSTLAEQIRQGSNGQQGGKAPKAEVSLSNDTETRVQSGETRLDFGDAYADDSNVDSASSVGAQRRYRTDGADSSGGGNSGSSNSGAGKSSVLPNDPKSVRARGYIDSADACYAISKLSLNDPNLINNALPLIRNGGFADFSTGGVEMLIFNGDAQIVPVIRKNTEYFSATAVDAANKYGLDVVVNGPQYSLGYPASRDVYAAYLTNTTLEPHDPSLTTPDAEVIQNGKIVAGRSSPLTFFVEQKHDSSGNIIDKFGMGNPSTRYDVGFGGAFPLIIDGMKYGSTNVYDQPISDAPISGPAGKYQDDLVQRSNNGFKNFVEKYETNGNYGAGKVIVAYSSNSSALAVVFQADGAKSPMSVSQIRDRLYNAGFDNAIAFDGSSSTTLVTGGQLKVKPVSYKDGVIDVGIGIKRR